MAAEESLSTQFVFHKANPKAMGGVPHHTVEAWAPEHAGTDWAKAHPSERNQLVGSFMDPGIRPIGSMSWHHQTGEVRGIDTDPGHRRQGVASSMWAEGQRVAGETRGVKLPKHSAQRTTAGDAWAKSVGGRLPKRDLR